MNEDLSARLARLSPEKRALLELRMSQGAHLPKSEPPLERRSSRGPAPQSFAQQRMWFLERLEANASLYHIPLLLRINGDLDVLALHRALSSIVARHEALRTTFRCEHETPVQVIKDHIEIDFPTVDLSALPQSEREAELQSAIHTAVQRPFNLAAEPVLRAMMWRLAHGEYALALVIHHIAADGWSLNVLCRELSEFYEANIGGKPAMVPELPIQYVDYSCWQREEMKGKRLERQLQYWTRQLAGSPEILELPTFQARPAIQTYRGASASLEFSPELTRKIRRMCEREGVTLFMFLLATYKVLLMRYTRQSDIVVGSPIAGRVRAETESLIGCFVNSLAFRTDLSGNPTFRELLQRVREVSLGAYGHQDLPLEKLVEELQPRRSRSHTPLFQVMFSLQSTPVEHLRLGNLSVAPIEIETGISKFDLTLFMNDCGSNFKATIEYSTDLFKPAFISSMLGHLESLCANLASDTQQRILEVPLLPPSEHRQMVYEWSRAQSHQPVADCIQDVFQARVRETPDAVALIFGEKRRTYREVNCAANQMAHFLRKRGIGPDVLVAVCMDRSLEMVVTLLAVLKAGGAFVPLDPMYPAERLKFMIEDTQTPLMLVHPHLRGKLPKSGAEIIEIDREDLFSSESTEDLTSLSTPENLAYVMYTSGSTGRPKGVCVPHRGVVRLVKNTNYARFGREEVFVQLAPISFDASTFEIWGALLNGAKLVIYPEKMTSLREVGEVLQRHKVTTLWLTAGLFHQMVDDHLDGLRSVRQLLAGGDVLSVPHVKAATTLEGCSVINGYGPTENTTFSCCHTVVDGNLAAQSIPIGRPIENTHALILDRSMNPVPAGVAGELFVGGEGLARGYLNRPELTAAKFVPHPFKAGARLYRTGDEARFLPDGTIEFLGRVDNQVKIRGFRIELGEIESVLRQHRAVREAIVIARSFPGGDKRLIAYLVPANGAIDAGELRRFAKEKLPEYMVPSAFVSVAALPLSPNGKVDRNALPSPEIASVKSDEGETKPWLPIQFQLMRIWESLLGIKSIGLRDDFFALGGHSLLAAKMVDRVERECGVKLPLTTLFSAPTIESLSNYLLTARVDAIEAEAIKVQAGNERPPFFHLDGDLQGGGFYCLNLARQLGTEQPFYALRPSSRAHMYATIEEKAQARLKTLRAIKPRGPYMLGGFCVDALVAFEMACQLQREGQGVSLLVLIDPPACSYPLRFAADALSKIGNCAGLRPETTLRYFKRCLIVQKILEMSHSNKMKYFRQRFKRSVDEVLSGIRAQGSDDEISRLDENLPVDVLTAHLWSAIRYRPKAFCGPVNLFISGDLAASASRVWRNKASRLDVFPIPGEHLGLITRQVETLGRELKACITRTAGCATSGRVSECLLSAS